MIKANQEIRLFVFIVLVKARKEIDMCIRKLIAVLIALCVAVSLIAGCTHLTKESRNTKDNRPTIVVGSDIYPPYNYTDEHGNPTGIDVKIAKEAFGKLGYRAVFRQIDWEKKDELVESGQIDCIWGCFSMEGRTQDYQWAGPYMVSHQVVAVDAQSSIYHLSDLKDKIIAVQSTTKPEMIFLKHEGNIPKAKNVYSFENREYIYTALGKGYVDAIAAHETAVKQYLKDFDADYRILKESILTTGLGVAFAKTDQRGIAAALSKELDSMRRDGRTKKILEQYVTNADEFLEVDVLEK